MNLHYFSGLSFHQLLNTLITTAGTYIALTVCKVFNTITQSNKGLDKVASPQGKAAQLGETVQTLNYSLRSFPGFASYQLYDKFLNLGVPWFLYL